jgi:hypothetical protein
MRLWSAVLAATLAANSATGAERQFRSGEPVVISQDDAYVLIRIVPAAGRALQGTVKYTPLLIRELSEDDLGKVRAAFDKNPLSVNRDVEPNVVEPDAKHSFAEAGGTVFLLTSLRPGTYVLGGVAVTSWALTTSGLAVTCLCMGTLKFEARPGVVTDLGSLLVARDDQPTDVPELAKVVSGKPRGFGFDPSQIAIRPAAADTDLPDALKQIRVVPAAYAAVGDIPNYIGAPISRLAPMPGVLDYDQHGHVIGATAADAGPKESVAAK